VTWLRDHARGIVADYPDPAAPNGRWAWKDVYEQYNHHRPLWQLSTSVADSDGERTLAGDLAARVTPSVLAVAGVHWVVLHAQRYRALHEAVPTPACGLRRAATFSNGVSIYRVDATVDTAWVSKTGFYSLYNPKLWPESLGMRWMGDQAAMRIYSHSTRTLVLSTLAVSLNRDRTISVVRDDGEVVAAARVNPTGSIFSLTIPVEAGFNDFVLRADPGAEVRGDGDTRRVTIAMNPFRIQDEAGATIQPECPRS
jgi:hypothetical protein